jgi:hypothetical protein
MVLPLAGQEIQPISLEDRLLMSYAELLEPAKYSHEVFEILRSRIESERDEKIEASRKTEKKWKTMLDEAHTELEEINGSSSVDTPGITARRAQIHIDIGALERGIGEQAHEVEVTIPSEYNKQLAKLWLIEHWPGQRDEILHRIDQGNSRNRAHGDVEDIGYRIIAKHPEKDVDVGRQAARQMAAGGWLPAELQDAEVQTYVRRLANRIAINSDLKVPLHVSVLDSEELRITALPGGFLYVNSGILLAAHTESEFAGVLSREIARIAARHAARASKRSLGSKVFIPLAQVITGAFSGGLNPGTYYGIGIGIQGLGGFLDKAADRSAPKYQKEADQLGVQYAWKAGFDPRGSLEFLDSLKGDVASDILSDEPTLQERLLNIFSEITYLPPHANAVVDSPEFHATRARLRIHSEQ